MSEQEEPLDERTSTAEGVDEATSSATDVEASDASDSGAANPISSEPVEAESVSGEGVGEADSSDAEEPSDEDLADAVDGAADAEPQPVMLGDTEPEEPEEPMLWYILKVQVNRESSICDALQRRVKMEGLEQYFGEILVPTEDVREFTKSGKQRIVKRKLYPGYIVVNMIINDDTWFLVRETPGIGDFTGAVGKPAPLNDAEIGRIKQMAKIGEESAKEETTGIKTAIKFRPGDRVRVKEGYFQNFEGDVETIDESNGRVTVMISIFGRATPVELDHWQVEDV
jgi:transcriptional antiterminator NusG